ncbi:hypothetical protein QVD17_42505 [Tagetes erecta]|uniref:ABC transmembrane type-1 domain-containing protein n=1 Tax=Tagetes erecta TaxID=13708 RepID=A0AAD8NDF3_TARER|nr:hypothetical protein QVD17_42505 [Tagetes erecta]
MLAQFTYDDTDWAMMSSPPDTTSGHWFGTDSSGRDLLVRVAIGGRISLMVGVASALIAVIVGTLYGSIAGYLGGKTDSVMMRILEILNSFPFMFFVILLVTFFGRNILLIFAAIGMVSWLDMARIVRGQTLSLKRKEFIEAAHVGGVSTWKIVLPGTGYAGAAEQLGRTPQRRGKLDGSVAVAAALSGRLPGSHAVLFQLYRRWPA